MCSKFGSHVFDTAWSVASFAQREVIAVSLLQFSSKVRGNRFGGHIWHNVQMDLYTQNNQKWQQIQREQKKKQKLFQDIVPGRKIWFKLHVLELIESPFQYIHIEQS